MVRKKAAGKPMPSLERSTLRMRQLCSVLSASTAEESCAVVEEKEERRRVPEQGGRMRELGNTDVSKADKENNRKRDEKGKPGLEVLAKL